MACRFFSIFLPYFYLRSQNLFILWILFEDFLTNMRHSHWNKIGTLWKILSINIKLINSSLIEISNAFSIKSFVIVSVSRVRSMEIKRIENELRLALLPIGIVISNSIDRDTHCMCLTFLCLIMSSSRFNVTLVDS